MSKGYIESHTHAGMIPYAGFQAMADKGINKAMSCAIVLAARHAESYFDHFRMIEGFYRKLAASFGIELFSAVGVHPAGIPDDWPRVIESLPDFISSDTVVAIGEVGMNQNSTLEKDVLRAQLEVAKSCNVPAIIHTPKENRPAVVDEMLNIAGRVGVDPTLLVIDHAHLDIIGQINDFGAVPGLTMRVQNLTADVLVEHLDLFARGMMNSDYSNIMPNDPAGFVDAVEYMQARQVDENIINALARDNAARLYHI
ncbi:TatD family hydrolase [Desulfoscipio gibsoniae]|uniref:Putative metal-dependent hydrolase with TIM-barrel fold n=1 Tax=Desulfoscipio gibsoniae DSM 7213 TaxID=767817 RepID=R4KJM0_9FIRM|nr:TatD family hydrolase [Desulfoscipio gibsoniae]AGL01807.1 putative metal-dependent hydrolase with TIM-barrel fold [Desulfoscipio gibsoniae DSM 7213]